MLYFDWIKIDEHWNFFYTMIDDDVRKICQRNFVSDSFDRYLDNKICLKTKDRKWNTN
jgi:hypothetical protein